MCVCVVNASLILLPVLLSFSYNDAPLSSHAVCGLRSTSAGVSCVRRLTDIIQCVGKERPFSQSHLYSNMTKHGSGPKGGGGGRGGGLFVFQAVVLESRCDKYLPPVAPS